MISMLENEKDLYGLLDSRDNSFYIVEKNYQLIKLIQILLIKQKFFYCINISKLPGVDAIGDITNENCHQFGVSAPMIKYIRFDSDPGIYGCGITKSKRPHNKILRDNLVSLQKLLGPVEKFFKDFENKEIERYQDEISGLLELKSFLNTVIPGDKVFEEFIASDIEERQKSIQRARPLKSEIFKSIMDIDFFRDDAIQALKKMIESFSFGNREYLSNTSDKIFLGDIVKKLMLTHL